MWHYVVIEIERTLYYTKGQGSICIGSIESMKWMNYKFEDYDARLEPQWNILYKAPIEYDELSSVRGPKDAEAFRGCEVWIEQNKVPGSKYAIMKMYIV